MSPVSGPCRRPCQNLIWVALKYPASGDDLNHHQTNITNTMSSKFCCSLFKVPLHKLCAVNKQLGFSVANSSISDDYMYIINMIKELLCVKYQQFELSSFFNRQDIDCMIDFFVLLLSFTFSFFLFYCVLMYDFIINKINTA